MKKRIWELDAFRGLCILGMVLVHLVYDLTVLYKLVQWQMPEGFHFVQQWGGVIFFLVSGISATLGSRSVRRGILVICCGLVVSAVTWGMVLLKLAGNGMQIYFGVLHCLGCCMLLWGLITQRPAWAVALLSVAALGLGFWFRTLPPVETYWLMPFGRYWPGFASSDYFPLLPYLGFFLAGTLLGRLLYREKKTLLPGVNPGNPILRALGFCSRHSLWIYMLHQPVLAGLCMVLTMIL